MRSDTVLGLSSKGFHRIHYTDWGNPDAERIVICVHGLTRNCRDFDTLAQALVPDFRVICPDVVGRGKSDWLQAKEDYGHPQYCADMAAVIARVTGKSNGLAARLGRLLGLAQSEKKRIYWVGTSMGGLIGMVLAAQPKSPIERLILNDVGGLIPRAALQRIGNYVGKDPRFKTIEELEAMTRLVLAPFGALTDAQWQHLTVTGAKQFEDGSWGLCHDPGIAIPFGSGMLTDVDLWKFYDAIRCPTLVLRGAQSDLLLKDTAEDMTRRGPKAKLVEFEGIGHAPTLMAGNQIGIVHNFLLGN
jgi:pimeloyl-ACP methyl ester carboxylesterase